MQPYAVPASPGPPVQAREEHRPAQKNPEAKPSPQAGPGAGTSDGGIKAFILKKYAPLSVYLTHAHIETGSDDTVKIEFPGGDPFMGNVKEPAMEAKLRELCSEFFQKPVRLSIVASLEKKKVDDRKEKEQSREDHRQQALHNPVVQKVIEAFNGKIIDIRTDL